MSTTDLGRYQAPPISRPAAAAPSTAVPALHAALAPLASLRLTVVLLGLSLVLVLAGTLAQVDHGLLYVLDNYFRTWWAQIELRIFFPRAWNISPSAVFPFPGGKLLGVALATNLVAAHALRFKVAASGRRLWLGWLTLAVGVAVTYAVIASGANTTLESQLTPQFVNGLWHAFRAAVGATTLTLAYVLALTRVGSWQSATRWVWWLGAVVAVLLGAITVYLFMNPAARLDAAGLRILWQLTKASAASIILGAGCWAVFAKRAGIVLLHSGIGLIMFTELYTAQYVVESQMSIPEGGTAYWADDIRAVEFAVSDVSDPKVDRSTVVPGVMLAAAARNGETISHADLPFDLRVVEYLPNATWRRVQPGEESRATAGLGQLDLIEELASSRGVDADQSVELPAAYVELLSKADGKSLGVYLTRMFMRGQPAAVDGKNYEVSLRFKRIPKPYSVTLLDFKYDKFVGTDMAKNFESVVRFQDPRHNVDRTASIWMNNPLRYGGDTLYQASFDKATEQTTVLQVMTNSGWMVPYVACMIVAAGMLVHFTQAIIRFVIRREGEARLAASSTPASLAPSSPADGARRWRSWQYGVPAIVVVLAALTTARFAAPPREKPLELHIHEFGKLPVAYRGRLQPMDSLARNTLRIVSGKATYTDDDFEERQPAIRWLLDVVSLAPQWRDHRVVRIENLDVLAALDLPQRPGDWRYSLQEIYSDVTAQDNGEFERQRRLAATVPEDQRDLTQRKFLELSDKVSRVMVLRQAFDIPPVGETGERVLSDAAQIEEAIVELNRHAARPVPPATPQAQWLTVYEASYNIFRQIATTGREPTGGQATQGLLRLLGMYRKGDAAAFNEALAEYQTMIDEAASAESKYEQLAAASGERIGRKSAERLNLGRLAFESYFNHFDPFVVCIVFYVAAFILAALAWTGWSAGFNRSANWLLWFTFALHTFGLVCRIYISGRPPVTNLYSSAVFIGWAAVLFALVFEVIYKLGIGNLLAAIVGFPTMVIAYYLTFDNDGDTLAVMQAVLDTNFWLSTHVVCIALGYSTTLLAGALGLLTLLLGYIGRVFDDDQRRQITRMTYGTLCFAIFFSFIGTVLGGLWADDSWGRFWGWDPKENGALMIVLWNAIVLHARWGKMVGPRGLAALAVLGNIVVAWSWWGVNQLGVGLHAYGWTSGLTFWLTLFDVSMLAAVIATYAAPLFARAPATPPKPVA